MNIHMTTLACPYCERGHLTLNSGMATCLPYINRLNSNKITSDKHVEVLHAIACYAEACYLRVTIDKDVISEEELSYMYMIQFTLGYQFITATPLRSRNLP